MKEYQVSLYLISDQSISTKKEFSLTFGMATKDFKKKPWAKGRKPKGVTYWMIDSDLEENCQPQEHILHLLEKVREIKNGRLLKKTILDVAIFFSFEETPFPSLTIPSEIIIQLEKNYLV